MPLRCVDSRHLFAECPTGFQDAFVFMVNPSAALCGVRRWGPDRAASVPGAGKTRGQWRSPKPCGPDKARAPLPWGAASTLRTLPLPPRNGARPHSASAAPLNAGICRQSRELRRCTPRYPSRSLSSPSLFLLLSYHAMTEASVTASTYACDRGHRFPRGPALNEI